MLALGSRRYGLAAVVLILAGACTHASPGPETPRWVDLTHPFDETTIYWPTSKPFALSTVHKGPAGGGYWYEANNFEAAEHGGTHIDAPVHFAKDRWAVDAIPLDRLIAPGIRVDVSGRVQDNADYLISRADFIEWEARHGRIEAGSIVLVRTGWEARWPDKKRYLGTDTTGDTANLHFPGFHEDAARFLTQERNVAAVGLDTASLDFGQSTEFKAHRVFGAANVPGFENLTQLGTLPVRGFRVIALPMKIGGGSGAPLRIIAEIP
ncbi:cyclase family protein [Nitrospina watsonii]|uniref:Secreted protein n=1 Tax=Nitrospina watsonii TaxID=1323948 RepID=A0ABN8W242_9BACT|nr:cyclase family protein [Nitrospina watsonii]CAI2718710.1 Putative secreted protein [Nitrospina watsonii]